MDPIVWIRLPVFWSSPVTGWLVQPHPHYCPRIQFPEVSGNPLVVWGKRTDKGEMMLENPITTRWPCSEFTIKRSLGLLYFRWKTWSIGIKFSCLVLEGWVHFEGKALNFWAVGNVSLTTTSPCLLQKNSYYNLTTVILNEYHTDTYILNTFNVYRYIYIHIYMYVFYWKTKTPSPTHQRVQQSSLSIDWGVPESSNHLEKH